MKRVRLGYFPRWWQPAGHTILGGDSVAVYRIGVRGGVQGYEGSCRFDELEVFAGGVECVRISAGDFVKGRWTSYEEA